MNSSIRERVIQKLNAELGSDVKNLSKCEFISKKYAEEKENIEKEIIKASTMIASIENECDVADASRSIEDITKEFNKLCVTIKEKKSTDDTVKDLHLSISKIEELEQGLSYLQCVQSIQDISSTMELLLTSRNDGDAVSEFVKLCQMSSRLYNSKCSHLTSYLNTTLHHWHNVLKDLFSVHLEEVLKSAGWPVVSSSVLSAPPADTLAKFQTIVKHLLNIQLPPEISSLPAVSSSLLGNFPPLSLPISLMLKPLKKRFIFHFCSNKQTNRPDKPEWFLTQVLTWIRDHEHFLTQWVQPVFSQTNRTRTSAKMEFTQGLVQLVVDKLHTDLPALMFDDTLFSHTVDETLAFDRELRDSTGYPDALPSTVTVLTQAQVFVKWIHMERKYVRDKMDNLLSGENAWSEISGSDDLKITEAAEGFLTLLSMMTNRYSVLPQPGHRLQFVELQLELVDELRVRLLQLLQSERHEPLDSRLPAILNTASHISTVLSEWGTNPHFLLLHHYRSQLECASSQLSAMEAASLRQGTVFDQALELLDHLIRTQLEILCEAVMHETEAKSQAYRRDRWFAMSWEEGCLTPSAYPMFQVLVAKLHSLEALLCSQLFFRAWQSVADQLCSFFLEEVILQNRFNEGGAKQLEQDLLRSVIPLFHQYTQRPEAYFVKMIEACKLLNIRPLPAEWCKGNYYKLPVDIDNLSPQSARDVIQRRADVICDIPYM